MGGVGVKWEVSEFAIIIAKWSLWFIFLGLVNIFKLASRL
jgi:hypothetical protein